MFSWNNHFDYTNLSSKSIYIIISLKLTYNQNWVSKFFQKIEKKSFDNVISLVSVSKPKSRPKPASVMISKNFAISVLISDESVSTTVLIFFFGFCSIKSNVIKIS